MSSGEGGINLLLLIIIILLQQWGASKYPGAHERMVLIAFKVGSSSSPAPPSWLQDLVCWAIGVVVVPRVIIRESFLGLSLSKFKYSSSGGSHLACSWVDRLPAWRMEEEPLGTIDNQQPESLKAWEPSQSLLMSSDSFQLEGCLCSKPFKVSC